MQGFCIQTFINVAGQGILERLTVKKEEHLVSFFLFNALKCLFVIRLFKS